WAGRRGLLEAARVSRFLELGDVRLRAVLDIRERSREAGWRRHVDGAEILIAVGAVDPEGERAVDAGGGVGTAGGYVRGEGPRRSRAGPPVRPGIDAEVGRRGLGRQHRVPRGEFRFHRIFAALVRRCQKSPLRTEEVEDELLERALGQVAES